MSRRHLHTFAEEKALIARAQDGDAAAEAALLRAAEGDIVRWARFVAHATGATHMVDDLEQEARVALLARIRCYNLDSYARLVNYAFPWLRSSMLRVACNNLEIVRITGTGQNHGAHREVDAGADPDEVAARRGMSPDAVRSLIRTTVPLSKADVEMLDDDTPDARFEALEVERELVESVWCRLTPEQRMVLISREMNTTARARMLGRKASAVIELEAQTLAALRIEAERRRCAE